MSPSKPIASRFTARDALEIPKSVRELRRAIETHMPEVGIEDVIIDVDRQCRFTGSLEKTEQNVR